jgi:GAF domain
VAAGLRLRPPNSMESWQRHGTFRDSRACARCGADGGGVGSKSAELHPEPALQHDSLTRGPHSVSAALTSARAEARALASNVRFPGEDKGHSLAEMAQRDLDAALQLLADRAQYITGASGAAIALRRNGKNDMLCRASSGSNAPELGALLSTEFGLSGESVRTRQPLRCDDAARDARVNREVCRQMGIASVVVMPVVNDDEVLGVFELFSGKANAFGARDVSAVQRLSEMVETAVRLAQATERLPEKLKMQQTSVPAVEAKEVDVLEDQALDGQVLEDVVLEDPVLEDPVLENPVLEEPELEPVVEVAAEENRAAATPEPLKAEIPTPSTKSGPVPSQNAREVAAPVVEGTAAAAPVAEAAPAKKKLFWSAALNPAADAAKPEEADQSHVPPVLRSLRKCEACGFPVSAGRVLCVECEEKKWRGQLKVPKAAPRQTAAPAPLVPAAPVAASPKLAIRAFAAAAASPMPTTQRASVPVVAPGEAVTASPAGKESKAGAGQPMTPSPALSTPVVEKAVQPAAQTSEASFPEFVLSAGLAPSQSWLARNKYILGVLLVVGVAVVAVFLLR